MQGIKITAKILKVMEEVKSVVKRGDNTFHKYKYATDADIVTAIRKSMISNKLVCIPSQTSCSANGELTTLLVSYTIIDSESGETITSQVYGYGQDKGDKGVYKAATGAEKYFLLKTFLLPTHDDPENEREPRKRATKEEIDAFDKSLPPKQPSPYIDNREAITLFQLIGTNKDLMHEFKGYLVSQGIEGSNKIPKVRYNEMYEWIIRNGGSTTQREKV